MLQMCHYTSSPIFAPKPLISLGDVAVTGSELSNPGALGGKGEKAHTARLWVYMRDDRPSGDKAPPAVWFQYSADRKGEHPARHLRNFSGILQADAYSGYDAIYKSGRVLEAGCWSHARRKLSDMHVRQKRLPGTLAHQGLVRIGELFKVEAEVNGRSALRRRRMRQIRSILCATESKFIRLNALYIFHYVTEINPTSNATFNVVRYISSRSQGCKSAPIRSIDTDTGVHSDPTAKAVLG